MRTHKLIDDTLVIEADGIVARCVCGWESRPHFSSMTASCAFRDHKDGNGDNDDERIASDKKRGRKP